MYNALIIEDDTTFRTYLRNITQKKFMLNITEAENGSQGLAAIEKAIPDIIFLDISMPVMDGIEFLQKIKLDENYSKIPVLVITAHNDRDSIQKIIKLGITDYILKPIDPATTFSRIQKVLDSLG